MAKRIRLAFQLSASPSAHSIGGWRHPRSYRGFHWGSPDYWEHVGRTLERGRLDMGFFTDNLQLHDDYRGSADAAIRYAIQFPRLDPMPFVPVIARATRQLGIGVTASTGYVEPFYFARQMATLDWVTQGRVGWNIVAGYGQAESRNLGREGPRGHDERYERAEEFASLCYRLWDSWEPEAIVEDRETGVFADPTRVHRFRHQGQHFSSAGPLSASRSPQGRPLIIQAGQSAEGLAFAARHAEVHFAARASVQGMRQHMERLHAALKVAGREPDSVKVLWSTAVFVAETDAEAQRIEASVVNSVPIEAGIALLSGHLGVDLSTMPLDEPLRNIDPDSIRGIRGIYQKLITDFGSDFTLREAARLQGAGVGSLKIVGSPRKVADQLEELIDSGGGHGFNIRAHTLPAAFEDFVNLVVPVLQARGRVWREYPRQMLRDNVMCETTES